MKSIIVLILMSILFLGACRSSYEMPELLFTSEGNEEIRFYYSDTTNDAYLKMLRTDYDLNTLAGESKTDFIPTLRLMNWTHNQWKHHNFNTPSRGDAFTILKEAEGGMDFRCVEYATVLKETLTALGIKSRTLVLKTKDAASKKSGAGHVLTEIYIRELNKWVLADPQFNMIPLLNRKPLNALELQVALYEKKEGLRFQNVRGLVPLLKQKKYLEFLSPYLYYFVLNFDQRAGLDPYEQKAINEKLQLMLVPEGGDNLETFQRNVLIEHCYYTHSKKQFYK